MIITVSFAPMFWMELEKNPRKAPSFLTQTTYQSAIGEG
jgi:hypothetical protein